MKYTEGSALDRVMGARGVTNLGLYIEVVRGSLGIKRLGALDYLRNHLKYRFVFVREASKLAQKAKKIYG